MSQPVAAASLLGLLSLAPVGLRAQGLERPRPSQPAPVFPAEAHIVWIDVAAVDPEGRPVADLGREDFEVLEGGERRPILMFRAPQPAAGTRVAVLVEDFLARTPQIERARSAVRRLAAGAAAGDRILLAAPVSGVSADAVLPADLPALAAALERIGAHPERASRLREPAEIRRLHASRVDAIESALVSLQGHTGSQALVVVGPSLPHEASGPFGGAAYERLMRASQRAAAPFYFLGCGEDPLSLPSSSLDPEWWGVSGGVARAAPLYPMARRGLRAQTLLLESASADSGGLAPKHPGEWQGAVDRILERSRASYLLGIPSVPATWDGGFHRIEVRALRKDVRVHARSGYFAPEPDAARRER